MYCRNPDFVSNNSHLSSVILCYFTSISTQVRRGKAGSGSAQYRLTLVKMMLEMIATGAAPSVIGKLIFIFARTINPDVEVNSLPHLRYIQHLRQVLHVLGEALGALQLSSTLRWDELLTDASSIRRLPIQAILLTYRDQLRDRKRIVALGGGGAVLENGESTPAVLETIRSTILNSGEHLEGLKQVAEELYPEYDHKIKDKMDMKMSKLLGGTVVTDSCNGAHSLSEEVKKSVVNDARESESSLLYFVYSNYHLLILIPLHFTIAGWLLEQKEQEDLKRANNGKLPDGVEQLPPLEVYTVLCWQHLRQLWFKGVDEELTQYLKEQFSAELEIIANSANDEEIMGAAVSGDDYITASVSGVVRLAEKLFDQNANLYEKGDQLDFAGYMLQNHKGALIIPLARALAGARHDVCCNGSWPILHNRPYYLLYLQRCIMWHRDKKKNKMIRAFWAILSSRRMVSCLRVCGILSVSIVMPHRCLAAKAHELHRDNSEWMGSASLCLVADGIYNTLRVLEEEPAKFLSRDFMLGIFDEWKVIVEFDEWSAYTYEDGRQSKTVGDSSKESRVFAMGRVLDSLFGGEGDGINNNHLVTVDTDEETKKLGLKAVCRVMEEMVSKKSGKNTRHFMSAANGKYSWAKKSEYEKQASRGRDGTNDKSESHFSHTKNEVLKYGTNLSTLAAGAVATMKSTGMMVRDLKGNGENQGYWHDLDDKMQNIIVVHAERTAKKVNRKYRASIDSFLKHKEKKFKQEEEDHIRIAFQHYNKACDYHRKIFTGECIMTVEDLDEALEGLSNNKQRELLREQFNIWRKGAGWSEAAVAFTKSKVDIPTDTLVQTLKDLISKYVDTDDQREVRGQVPRPSQMSTTKPLPSLGDELPDARKMRMEMIDSEKERINAENKRRALPERLDVMPDPESLETKWVMRLYEDGDDNDDTVRCVKMWYYGKVEKVVDVFEDSFTLLISWENDDTTEEIFEHDKFAGPNSILEVGSWKLGPLKLCVNE